MSDVTFRLNGASFRPIECQFAAQALKPGDVLDLESEPDNLHDPNAIKILKDSLHLGYVNRESCVDVRNALESNPALTAVVVSRIGKNSALVQLRETVAS